MSKKELVKKIIEYDYSVPKIRFPYGNDTQKNVDPSGQMSKKEYEGQRDKKRTQNVNHGWPNDKKTWFEHVTLSRPPGQNR